MEAKLTATLETLFRDGSPIASPDTYGEMAAVAIRRWNSFDRRTKIRSPTREDRIQDLTKGLCAAFEPDPSLAGHCSSTTAIRQPPSATYSLRAVEELDYSSSISCQWRRGVRRRKR
jgi:hypothetical protein